MEEREKLEPSSWRSIYNDFDHDFSCPKEVDNLILVMLSQDL